MMSLPHDESAIVIVTVVLEVYPVEAPLLPAIEKVPHPDPLPEVVVVVGAVVVVVELVVVVPLPDPRETVPSVSTTDSRRILTPPTVGVVWYFTTTLSRLRFCVPAIPGSSTQVTYW